MKNKVTKTELRVVNGKIMQVPVEENTVAAENNMGLSMAGHKAMARRVLNNIYSVVPVVKGILLRVVSNNGAPELAFEVFHTLGSNNPNSLALMRAAGDFNIIGEKDVQLSHWDNDEKTLVPDYKVKCNDTSKDRVYYETNTHCVVVYGALDGDINEVCRKWKDKDKRELKAKYVDQVQNLGLVMDVKGNVHINKGDVMGNPLTVLYWSPSNMRNETQLMTPIAPVDAFKILDEVAGGALSEALQGKFTIEDLIKKAARLGILGAPSTPLIKSGNLDFGYVIYMDEIEGPADFSKEQNEELIANEIEIDRNTYDGSMALSAEFVKASFAKFGIKISKKKALAFALQTRANKVFTKVFGETKSQENMQHRLEQLIAKVKPEEILRVEAGADVSGLDKSKYKLIIVGNEKCLGSIIDTNGGKLLKNISLQTIASGDFMTHLLDIAKCSKTKTSGQMLQKFLTADMLRTIDVIKHRLGQDLDNTLEHKLEGEINPHTCSLAEFILRYVPGGRTNTVALEKVIKDELKRQESIVHNLSVDIDAYFQRALFDDTYFLTGGKVDSLLTRNEHTGRLECYSKDIEVLFAEQIEAIESNPELSEDEKDRLVSILLTGAAFKYPSPSSDENALLTYQSSRQIRRKIEKLHEAGTITEAEMEILLDDFLNTSYGVTKIGADNTLKHKLAGMDTDYDGIAVVFEKDLVQILLDKYPTTDGVATIIC